MHDTGFRIHKSKFFPKTEVAYGFIVREESQNSDM